MSVPPMWEHILCAQRLPAREVQVLPLREPTILLVRILVQEQVVFLNREPLFFLWSTLAKPEGHSGLDTVDRDLMHHQYRLSLLQWNPGPARNILLILFLQPVVSFTRLFFRKPVIMFRKSPFSSGCTLTTWTSRSCSTRTPLSLTL